MTPAETMLWNSVRRNKTWLKIDRQKAVYLEKLESWETTSVIADFLSIEHKLIIEIQSEDTVKRDEYELDTKKDVVLKKQWYTILRLKEQEVIENVEKVLEKIKAAI